MTRTKGLIAVLLVSAAVIGGAVYAIRGAAPASPPTAAAPAPQGKQSSAPAEDAGGMRLYCQFYVFTEQRPRVAFYFDVAHEGEDASVRQIYIAEDNGQRQDYDEAERPEWRLDTTVQPPRISSRVSVPDTSQAGLHEEDIAIELYDYKVETDSPAFFEGSLKSVHFQNLPGKCRQNGAPA